MELGIFPYIAHTHWEAGEFAYLRLVIKIFQRKEAEKYSLFEILVIWNTP